jgi:RimJ/RimL family protein N-acetyltransferase
MVPEDVRLYGERVTIRPLRKIDLDVMSTWKPFGDPLYRLFDWPHRSPRENEIWFTHLIGDKTRVYYAVENEYRDLIGRVSLRDISDWSSRLGIGFGKHYVGHGYGTESLRVFLPYYFRDLGFEQIVLDVAAINRRAIRCYERCGFKYVGSHYVYAGTSDDIAFLEGVEYQHLRRFFRKRGHRTWMLSYDMALDQQDWLVAQDRQEQVIRR